MRKITCLLLAAVLLLSGCALLQEDHSEYAGIVADTETWYEEFTNLPVANENMTEEEA